MCTYDCRNDCPILDDSDGITLQSLGGVFIATLIGLALALLTLAVEVVLQRRKEGGGNKVYTETSSLFKSFFFVSTFFSNNCGFF